MLRFLFLLAVIGGGFAFIFYQIFNFFYSVGGSRSRLEKDIQELSDLARSQGDELVPIDNNELSLLAVKVKAATLPKSIYYTEAGLLTSIYGEPMMSFGYRRYGQGKSLLVLNTHESQFEFSQTSFNIELRINGYKHGIISKDHRLVEVGGKELAAIEEKQIGQAQGLLINGAKVASLQDPTEDGLNENSRAILELKPLNEVEQNILLAMTAYELLLKE